jgi:hypothetical protein
LGVLALALLAGCRHRLPVGAGDGGSPIPDGAPHATDTLTDAARVASAYIYVVDDRERLRKYHPTTNSFTLVGTLSCPAPWGVTPFSMAVERSGRAWVLYQNGSIYWVDTTDASCTPTPFKPNQQGFLVFGMAFVADGSNSATETLYIAGDHRYASSRLAHIVPSTLQVKVVGKLAVPEAYSAELTGTRDGRLFAYYPGNSKAVVSGLDKATAKALQSWPVTASKGTVHAYAFAHWGGRFHIFVTAGNDSRVLRLDPVTGKTTVMRKGLPFQIVGAGVSTHAPLVFPDAGSDAFEAGP